MPEPDDEQSFSFLNVFEIELDGERKHLVCFTDAVRAGALGIDGRAVVGEFQPGADQEFDPSTFAANPGFIEAVVEYMNERMGTYPEVASEASKHAGGMLYLIDPRASGRGEGEPLVQNVLGAFAVDPDGVIVPDSFRYNDQHTWFDPQSGVSGVFSDKRFYDWLNPEPEPSAPAEGEG